MCTYVHVTTCLVCLIVAFNLLWYIFTICLDEHDMECAKFSIGEALFIHAYKMYV